MSEPLDQVEELARLYPGTTTANEGGITYYLIPALELPAACTPRTVDALLCPTERDGYQSRLYYSALVTGGPQQNWHVNGQRYLDRSWYAFSWRTRPGLRLVQMVLAHLTGLAGGKT
jgi:hypothetical protein